VILFAIIVQLCLIVSALFLAEHRHPGLALMCVGMSLVLTTTIT
jgi:hypothetical protein